MDENSFTTGNNHLAFAFIKIIISQDSNFQLIETIQKLLSAQPPPIHKVTKLNKDTSFYYYCLYDIAAYFDSNFQRIDFTKLYLVSLRQLGKNWSDNLYPYLTSSIDIPEKQYRTVLKSLQSFATTFSGLYTALKPQISSILARIGPKNYVPILEFNIFDVICDIDPSIIFTFPENFINSSNVDKFWQFPHVLTNLQFTQLYQNLTAANEPFPLNSKLYKQTNMFTLLNGSISKRKHFIDMIFSLAHNTLMARDFSTVSQIVDVLPEMKPWLLLADFDDLYPDQDFFMSVIGLYEVPNCFLNVLQRFKNDNTLLSYIHQNLGVMINNSDFEKDSLPKILTGIIRNIEMDALTHFSVLDYFVISDVDRKIDFNFIFSYSIFVLIIDSFRKKTEILSDDFELYLQNIEIDENILIDLYSIIFLQNKEKKFLCSLQNAEILLSVLVQFSQDIKGKSKIISAGFSKIQQLIALGGQSFSDCFVSSDGSTFSALDNHDFEMAKHFASGNQKLLSIVQNSKSVFDFINGKIANDRNEKCKLEISMVTHENILEIDENNLPYNEISIISLVKERKKKKLNEVLNIIEPPTFFTNILNEFDAKISFGSNFEAGNRFVEMNKFLNYLELLSNLVPSFKNGSSLMELVIQSDRINEWDSVVKLLGSNALEKLIISCDLAKANESMVKLITKEEPIIGSYINIIKKKNLQKTEIGNISNPIVVDLKKISKIIGNKNEELFGIFANKKYNGPNSSLVLLTKLLNSTNPSNSDKEMFVLVLFNLLKKTPIEMNSDFFFDFEELIEVIFNYEIPAKVYSFLVDEIIHLSNQKFPLEFAKELRLRNLGEFDQHLTDFSNSLNLIELSQLFPEKADSDVVFFIDLGINSADPKKIIMSLIENNLVARAKKCAEEYSQLTFFNQSLIDCVISKINRNEEFESLFVENPLIASTIYQQLPSSYRSPQMQSRFNSIANSKNYINQNNNINNNLQNENIIRNENDEIKIENSLINQLRDLQTVSLLDEFVSINLIKIKNIEKLAESAKNALLTIIGSISVNSASEEDSTLYTLLKSIHILRKIGDKIENTELSFFYEFVQQKFNLRFNVHYNFTNKENLFSLCAKFDEFILLQKAKLVWPTINISGCLLEMATNAALLNQTVEYKRILDIQSKEIQTFADSSELTRILSHPNIFELNYNEKINHVEMSPLYYRVKMIISGNAALINKDLFNLTDQTIRYFSGEVDLVRFHNFYGRFQLTNLSLESLDVAIRSIVFPALISDHWSGLWRFLCRNLENGDHQTKLHIFVDQFLLFLREKKMDFALFDIENRLQHKEDAILAASNIFQELCSWQERNKYAVQLKSLAENELKERRMGKKPEKISDRSLQMISEKASITAEFSQFCINTKTPFDKSLDIIKSDKSLESMAFLAFVKKNFLLGLKIAQMRPNCTETVIYNSIDTIYNAGKTELESYMKELKNQVKGPEYETIALLAVECVEKKMARKAGLSSFIADYIAGNALQVSLLVKYGFLRNALKICTDKRNIQIIIDAANKANDTKLVKDCKKML